MEPKRIGIAELMAVGGCEVVVFGKTDRGSPVMLRVEAENKRKPLGNMDKTR